MSACREIAVSEVFVITISVDLGMSVVQISVVFAII